MITSIIIEDEVRSRKLLNSMINNYCEGIEVIGEAGDVKGGVRLIREKNPDIVFLDIEIGGGTGFDILNQVNEISLSIIIISGYDKYALKAIKHAALDYILKPIDLKELRLAIQKVYDNLESTSDKKIVNKTQFSKIVLSSKNQYQVIDYDEILFVQAFGNYVQFFLENGSKKMATNSLNYYEEVFPDNTFFRIHKSVIINLSKVERFDNGRTGKVILLGGHEINIAFRRKSEFLKRFKK